ncbi:MAG TPA: squalene/phytoene synthase family protein [Streptosporangiaceae bacterium]|nr:squalene/phytoene synthase family protein [Streptosporangiaceae bacterium]
MPPGSEVMDTRAAYRYCEEITWSQARNFAYGIRLLPPAKRQALAAVYAFARRIDDIGDGDLPAPAKLAALADARASVTALSARCERPDESGLPSGNGSVPGESGLPGGNGSVPGESGMPGENGRPPGDGASRDLVLVALADTANRFDIPLAAFGELIDGCEADVRGTTYRTFDDLLHYCRCVAGSIGRLSLGVFGTADVATAAPLADALGVALQLTNILRDIREDYLGGRIYLPAEDFERFGCSLGNGALGPGSPEHGASRHEASRHGASQHGPGDGANGDKLAALVEFEAERASAWYAKGLTLIPLLDWRSAASAGAMAGIYHRLLERIAATPGVVLERRMSLPASEKALVAARSLVVALRPHGAGAAAGKGAAR